MLDQTVLLDASVLYSAPLRDLLLQAALTGLFRAKWSAEIHAEWIAAVLRQRSDLKREALERTRDLMDRAILDAVVSDYSGAADRLAADLPDPGDLHVVAAALQAEAEIILTFNLKHFPDNVLAGQGLRAVHPDIFLTDLLQAAPEQMIEAIAKQRLRLRNPPKSAAEYLETLSEQRLTGFAKALAEMRAEI